MLQFGCTVSDVCHLSTSYRPNVQGFQEKVEKEEQMKRDGTDNRSFLQKYVSSTIVYLCVCISVSLVLRVI